MDLSGFDVCDKAKNNGMLTSFKQFQDCAINKKIFPLMPDGTHPKYSDLVYFKRLKEIKDKKLMQFLND